MNWNTTDWSFLFSPFTKKKKRKQRFLKRIFFLPFLRLIFFYREFLFSVRDGISEKGIFLKNTITQKNFFFETTKKLEKQKLNFSDFFFFFLLEFWENFFSELNFLLNLILFFPIRKTNPRKKSIFYYRKNRQQEFFVLFLFLILQQTNFWIFSFLHTRKNYNFFLSQSLFELLVFFLVVFSELINKL